MNSTQLFLRLSASLLGLGLTSTLAAQAVLVEGTSLQSTAHPEDGSETMGDPYYPGLGNGGYDVGHYDLVLDVDMAAGQVEGVTTVQLTATQDLRTFHLDLVGLSVSEITVAGQPATFTHEGRELEITPSERLLKGQSASVVVRYAGKPQIVKDPGVPFVAGVGWMKMEGDGIYVVSECIGAATVFPCNDHPRDKATYSFDIGVQAPWIVAANGIASDPTVVGELTRYKFAAKDQLASYLMTISIAEFDVVRGATANGLPLTYYFQKTVNERTRSAFDETEAMLAFFSQKFGPYPFECYGGIISGSRFGGALETQTVPVYSNGTRASTVAHEMAHQWFGNHVSAANWRDLWLNEGFAVFSEWLWAEHQGDDRLERRYAGAYRSLKKRAVGSPYDPGIAELFSGRVYTRGAWVLRALRIELGDDTFFKVVQTWITRFGGGHASTQEFTALATEIAGRDLNAWFDDYLYSDVTPDDPNFTLEAPKRAKTKKKDKAKEKSLSPSKGSGGTGN